MTFGMVGLGAAHGYELAAYGLTRSGDLAAATSALNGDSLGLPGVDPNIMEKSGQVLVVAALAQEYSFTDIDGRQPHPVMFEEA